jgi:Zn-dependent peptidase ImmA (M78 family)
MPECGFLELTTPELEEVKEAAASKLGVCKKRNEIIGPQIFSILSLYARVIYYPFGKDAVWGFTRIKGSSNNVKNDKPFVAINSSIPYDCQIFAAAHELYHIWFDNKLDVIPADIIDNVGNDRNELKANRFAAEFLVDEDLLWKELRIYSVDCKNVTLKDILKLADLFSVPYITMVRRFYEIGIFTKQECLCYSDPKKWDIPAVKKRYSIITPEPDGRIAIDNLTDLAMEAYEKKRITFERLEYLLSLSQLTPSDVGIQGTHQSTYPSDVELDDIMEE